MSASRHFLHAKDVMFQIIGLSNLCENYFRQVDNSHASDAPEALSHYSNKDGSEGDEKIPVPSIKSECGSHNPTSGPIDPSAQMNTVFQR